MAARSTAVATARVSRSVSISERGSASGSTGTYTTMLPVQEYAAAGQASCELSDRSDGKRKPIRLQEMLEKEARRIAQSLHDEAGQLLAAVHLKLDEAASHLPSEERSYIRELKAMLLDLESELRQLSHELRPLVLDDLGLIPALEFLRQGMARRTGIRISVEGTVAGRLPALAETALYRIIHQVLTVSHQGRARYVSVVFATVQRRVLCSIREEGGDGTGWDASLSAIRQRVDDLAGTTSAGSGPDGVRELLISIPLE